MNRLKVVLQELYGLFVDDGSYATALVVWMCVMWAMRSQDSSLGVSNGVVLFAGFGFILGESVLRKIRSFKTKGRS